MKEKVRQSSQLKRLLSQLKFASRTIELDIGDAIDQSQTDREVAQQIIVVMEAIQQEAEDYKQMALLALKELAQTAL